MPWEEDRKERFVGRSRSGAIHEQRVRVEDGDGRTRRFRRIRIVLKTATRDDDKVLTLLTNLSRAAAHAKHIAWMCRKRWTMETAFQELKSYLDSEINSLGYPKAALFAFCVALLAYNVLALVKGALRSEHGEDRIADEVSGYYLAGHLQRTYDVMAIAIPEDEWCIFRTMSAEEYTRKSRQAAGKVNLAQFRKHKRGPKKPRQNSTRNPKQPHVSTARLLNDRRVAK